LRLAYSSETKVLEGVARIRIKATRDLTRPTLDLRSNLVVKQVKVNRSPTAFSHTTGDRQKLLVHLTSPIEAGETFTVKVRYKGKPRPVVDPDGALDGWLPTRDGAVVASQPQGAPTWFPCNDTPADKASYRIEMTVDKGLTAISNGELVSKRKSSTGRSTYVWRQKEPMASYLATVAIGQFRVTQEETSRGIPIYTGVDKDIPKRDVRDLSRLDDILDVFSSVFGPYPFSSAGSIVVLVPKYGYALETQTRPVYTYGVDEYLMAHEMAHQWFGNSLTIQRWQDIWMSEGFATWAEWYWDERTGGQSAQDTFNMYMRSEPPNSEFWDIPPADPGGPENLFAYQIYERGALTLQALRATLGDDVFFPMLRTWVARNQHGYVSTRSFRRFVSNYTGRDLDSFFTQWLDTPSKPHTY